MCGVFGFVSRDGGLMDLGVLRTVAQVTQQRGPHAFGFAWIDRLGRLKCYKQTGKVCDHLGLLGMARDARLLIGHCRWATQGSPGENINNHPHPTDSGWIVHNGMIRNYDSLLQRFNLWPVSGCDSEVLGLLIEQEKGSLLSRCVASVQSVNSKPLVMLGLWKPGRLVAVRDGNPLHLGATRHGTYLASLPTGLPGKVTEFEDGMAMEFATSDKVRRVRC